MAMLHRLICWILYLPRSKHHPGTSPKHTMVLRRTCVPDPEFDGFVQQQMDKWKVPGLTMAIVHGASTWSKVGKPVYLWIRRAIC